ncbi:carboxylesterase family protein [Streptomyces axinellae]|uniref:carboxylesterase family protein n=1 Tax=Streptomyces axinellae TaxID=552788 RepID=UPI003CD09217
MAPVPASGEAGVSVRRPGTRLGGQRESRVLRGVVDGRALRYRGVACAPHRPVSGGGARLPLPPRPWPGVRDASRSGPPCPRRDTRGTSENCLRLDVTAPRGAVRSGDRPGSPGDRPVRVWLRCGGSVAAREAARSIRPDGRPGATSWPSLWTSGSVPSACPGFRGCPVRDCSRCATSRRTRGPTGASHAAEPLYLFDTKGTPTLRTSRAVRCPTRPGSVGRRTR